MEKAIALTGAEIKVEYGGGANAWLRNDGTATVYAARTTGIVAGADGVISIPAGQSAPIYGANGTVYLLGTGSVQLIGSDYSTNPFDGVSTSGAADIVSDAAGIVTLDGLQGGVPFSEIVLDGDIVGKEVTLIACGKNIIPYPFREFTKTLNGITFNDNGDGTVTVNGTATAATVFYITKELHLAEGVYTLSGCPNGGSNASYKMQFATGDWSFAISEYGGGNTKQVNSPITLTQCRIAIEAGTVCDNLVFCPQLERGDKATGYEQYHGSTVTLTPDSAPYTVPNDIRQQDGVNNVMVSAGAVQITGVRRAAALKRVWDKLDELTTAIIVSNGD